MKEDAKEGNKVCIKATEVDGKEVVNDGEASREILLARKNLFRAEIDGAVAYRIPVLTTAWDGSLVAITDNRKYSTSDIPQDIDIIVRRSTDNGKTWSEPVTMAKGTGFKQGFGDACIVKTNTENARAISGAHVTLGGKARLTRAASTGANPCHKLVL